LFKRILLTAVLGGGLLFTVPGMAQANPHADNSTRIRHDHPGDRVYAGLGYYGGDFYGPDWWGPLGPGYTPGYVPPVPPPGPWGTGYARPGVYEYGRLHFTGFDRAPRFYFAPPGVGADHGYWLPYLTDVFGDDYYVSYGFRCNGYRDGYYYGRDGRRWNKDGHDVYRRNADCDDFYARHGSWYGIPVCDAYDFETGYCDVH